MLLKLKKTLLLSGLGLIAIGAITPVIASCSKSSKNNNDPEFLYTLESVKNLFDQFKDNYRNLPRAEGVSQEDIEAEILGFEAQLAEQEAKTADLPDNKKFALRSEWIIDLAKQYDIVLVEWQQVGDIRDSLFEGIMAEGGYGDEFIAATIAQQELIEQGIDGNQSFNEYLDTAAELNSNFIDYSPTLFPRTHAYALHGVSSPVNSHVNAAAAKANLLSQMISGLLTLNEQTNIISYLTNEENSPFQDGAIEYNTIGVPLDRTQVKTTLVDSGGKYIDSKNTAYRLLTKDAQKALFNYSYLDLEAAEGAHTVGQFDGTKIFPDDHYDVDIALHVKSPESSELFAVENYNDFSVALEYDVVVTDTANSFSPYEDSEHRYADALHNIPYFGLVGARNVTVSMPDDMQVKHANYYLKNTLKYDFSHPESIVKSLGVSFSNVKKDSRGANGRPTDASKLTEDDINHFYFLTTETEEKEDIVSFTSQYGTNGEINSVKNKWLIPRDADAAVHLQISGFVNSPVSYFGSEYVDAQGLDKTPKSLTITEANTFLEQVLGVNTLQFGVRVDDVGSEEGMDVLVGSYVKLGVYLGEVVENPSAGQDPLTNLISVAAHDNVNKQLSETTQLDSWESFYKTQSVIVSPEYKANQFYLPLFTSARQASNMKFCAGLLEKDNLAKHAKIMEFIDYPVFSKFAYELDELSSTNKLYASLNIVMTVAYAIKLVYDVFILATSWAIPPLAAAAALQVASDLFSIGFLVYEIYGTFQSIYKIDAVLDIFYAYIKKSSVARGGATEYKIIKDAYDAYMTQLNIYKDVTKSPSARANAADLVANVLYDKFMVLLTGNLFDFVNDSVRQEAGFNADLEREFAPDLGWGAVKGVAELGPFLIDLILHIILTVLFLCFVKVAGVMISNLIKFAESSTVKLISKFGVNYAASPTIQVMTELGGNGNLALISQSNAARASIQQIGTAQSMMKISGIAGIILGVMDILFTVGYSLLISSTAADVNALLDLYLLN